MGVLNVVFLLFLASEGLLFVSSFWASFHSLSSPTLGIWPGEGFYIPDPCELTFANTLLLSNAAVSLGGAFVSLEISCSFLIFFSLFSFILAWTFISLQIIEFRIMGLSINDSFYSCIFFFLTGLHFFHLVLGLLLISLFYWGSSFPSKIHFIFLLRSSEIHLFYNQLFFYWHFVEVLWLFIFLVLYLWFFRNLFLFLDSLFLMFALSVYQLMIHFIVVSSYFLQDFISFILSLVFFLSH